MSIPSNVINFQFTNNPEKDIKTIRDLLHPGTMVLVDARDPLVYKNTAGVYQVADYSNGYNEEFSQWTSSPIDPVTELVNMNMYGYFVKASDLFYSRGPQKFIDGRMSTDNLYLRCEDDWYQIDFGRRFPFILNNAIPFGVYNIEKHNMIIPNDWGNVDYSWEVLLDEPGPWNVLNQPQTPPNKPPFARNLEEEFDNERQLKSDLDSLLNYEDEESSESSESDMELTSGSESEDGNNDNDNDNDSDNESDNESLVSEVGGYAQDPDDDLESDYSPSESEESDSDSDSESELSDMDDEFWDEKRQDVDGYWYTRRQFYDYYGSDDAWDNLDPNVYHQYRYDDQYGIWACKEEFYQHYGTDRIWKRMHPMKRMKRKAIWDTYCWSMYLPEHLRFKFIKQMMKTYK